MTSFDYVVIGAGTAGLALAARLAENPNVTVCVLEAGEDYADNEDVKVPGNYMTNIGKSFDGGLLSTPQAGTGNRVIYNPRGKGVGGSSILNWMQLMRAPSVQYDDLEADLGAQGWNSKEFLKYFKKSQSLPKNQPKGNGEYLLKPNPALYGDGPIVHTFPRFTPAINSYYYKACAAMGVPFNPSGGDGNNFGVWPALSAVDPETATRVSSTAYIKASTTNLKIITDARASQIIFQADSKPAVATAVRYRVESTDPGVEPKEYTVNAKKEVILCAGAFHTPQLLEQSGIGGKEYIPEEVTQIVDLPGVGNNLRECLVFSYTPFFTCDPVLTQSHMLEDHISTLFLCETDPSIESYDIMMNANPDLALLGQLKEDYKTNKSGIYSTVPLSFSYVPLKTFASEEKIAKIKEAAAAATTANTSIKSTSSIKLLQKWMDDEKAYQLEFIMVPHHVPFLPNGEFNPAKKYCFFSIVVDHPFSRGSAHIDPSSPGGSPVIDLGLLENDIDREILVEGIKFIQKLISTPSMKDNASVRAIAPGPNVVTDEAIKEYLNHSVFTAYHPIGTASMLPREEGGVVDPNLKVYGTANLRVADGSVIPVHLSTHPMATVYAIGEKAADIIKAA